MKGIEMKNQRTLPPPVAEKTAATRAHTRRTPPSLPKPPRSRSRLSRRKIIAACARHPSHELHREFVTRCPVPSGSREGDAFHPVPSARRRSDRDSREKGRSAAADLHLAPYRKSGGGAALLLLGQRGSSCRGHKGGGGGKPIFLSVSPSAGPPPRRYT